MIISTSGCGKTSAKQSSIVVFNAGALALPLRQALDSFAPRHGLTVSQENAGSVETVRKIIDLNRVPDVVAVADTALFSHLMPGRITGPVAILGSSHLVLAYTNRSRFASEVNSKNWADVTTRPGVQVGRSDPSLDPAGYRALMAMQLAARFYAQPDLEKKLEAAASTANMRPKSADLVALLQTGNLDYAWEYESVAHRLGLRFVALPPEVDLSDPALAATYATAKVEIPASGSAATAQNHEPLVMVGAPIVFGAGVPTGAPNPDAGHGFITYLMSTEGRSILDSYGLVWTAQPAAAETK
jgi:molybdate/tungstate transport system substrate-binding protein